METSINEQYSVTMIMDGWKMELIKKLEGMEKNKWNGKN